MPCQKTGNKWGTAGCDCRFCSKLREQKRVWIKRKRKDMTPKAKAEYDKLSRSFRGTHKEEIMKALGGKCAICGFVPEHSCQMDIHEINGRISDWNGRHGCPSNYLRSKKGFVHLMKNLDRLMLLCRNCHSRLGCKKCKEKTIPLMSRKSDETN